MQNDVISCAQQVELLEQQLATRMEQLQATVQSKTAVPTAQVYVSFRTLHVKDRLINLFILRCILSLGKDSMKLPN